MPMTLSNAINATDTCISHAAMLATRLPIQIGVSPARGASRNWRPLPSHHTSPVDDPARLPAVA